MALLSRLGSVRKLLPQLGIGAAVLGSGVFILGAPISPYVSPASAAYSSVGGLSDAQVVEMQKQVSRDYHTLQHNRRHGVDTGSVHAATNQPLKPDTFQPFTVTQSMKYNHNTNIYKFNIPDQTIIPVSSFVVSKAKIDGKDIFRPYTPIFQKNGEITLLIKDYKEGTMSKHFTTLKQGDVIELKGPLPKLPYLPNMKKSIGMIAGGTGITPCLQVIKAVLNNPEDKTQVVLLYGNTSEPDMLLRHELEYLQSQNPNFRVHHVISKPTSAWRGLSGRIDKQMIRDYLPGPANDTLIYISGPPGMYESLSGSKAKDFTQGTVGGALKDLGFQPEQVYKF